MRKDWHHLYIANNPKLNESVYITQVKEQDEAVKEAYRLTEETDKRVRVIWQGLCILDTFEALGRY